MVSLKEAECIARNVIPDLRSCEDEPFAFLFYAGEEFFGDMVPNFNAAIAARTASQHSGFSV